MNKYLWPFLLISVISICALFTMHIYKALLVWFGATFIYLIALFLAYLFNKDGK